MFNVGGGELIVILLIALIVLGPQRLPDAARQIGKAMADLRRVSTGFQDEVRSALDTADDPNRVAARRNPLAKEAPAEPAEPAEDAGHPPRTEPLVAGPPMEPRNGAVAPSPRPPTAQARAAAKKAAANGTAVAKSTETAGAAQPDAEAAKSPPET